MQSHTSPEGQSISPTALDSACQCDAKNLYEKDGFPSFGPWAAAAVHLGGDLHLAVEELHEQGVIVTKRLLSVMVPTSKGPVPVAEVAARITAACFDRFPAVPDTVHAWAVERRFAFYCDPGHTVFMRGRIDYAPFTDGICDAVIDLKSKGRVSPKLNDLLVSNTMHRQLFAAAIACMVHSRATQVIIETANAAGPDQGDIADIEALQRVPYLGTWENPIAYEAVADAIDNAPLPECWLLIWDKDNNRPVWRAHKITRQALRGQLRLACDKAHTFAAQPQRPSPEDPAQARARRASWPRTYNCAEPWECPHQAQCALDLADPVNPDTAAEYANALVGLRLGA